MAVVVGYRLTEAQTARIRAAAGPLEVVVAEGDDRLRAAMPGAEVLFGRLTPDLLERAPHLRWVQTQGAGVDGLLFPDLVASDVVLTSEKGHVGPHLAEQAFALLLALTRGVAQAVRHPGRWDQRMALREASWELTDKTMGLVGLGGTGRAVAERARPFGCRLLAVDAEPVPAPPGVEAVWGLDRLDELLAASDVVVVCAPLTPATRGLFGRRALARMRPHAVLINVTRGGIVDGDALVEALEAGRLGGAGLDVTPQEPLPPEHPLWRLPNVVITPHVAGGSPLRQDRVVDLFCANLGRFRAGAPLEGVIDKRKGY
jgi:phosphoglycerate dehydrogenase-like enzyme